MNRHLKYPSWWTLWDLVSFCFEILWWLINQLIIVYSRWEWDSGNSSFSVEDEVILIARGGREGRGEGRGEGRRRYRLFPLQARGRWDYNKDLYSCSSLLLWSPFTCIIILSSQNPYLKSTTLRILCNNNWVTVEVRELSEMFKNRQLGIERYGKNPKFLTLELVYSLY